MFETYVHTPILSCKYCIVFFSQAIRLLDEEERQDTQMREHFKEKWTPKPSAELTVNLREECAKYRAIVENATNADKVIKEKYNNHRTAMELLSKSDVSQT